MHRVDDEMGCLPFLVVLVVVVVVVDDGDGDDAVVVVPIRLRRPDRVQVIK